MKPTVVYIHVAHDGHHHHLAERYVESVLNFPANYEHDNLIISQNAMPSEEVQNFFSFIKNVRYHVHDDTGWDIGGYVAAAKILNQEAPDQPMLCLGGSATVRKAGWLNRLMEAWQEHGPGVYGTNTSYQFRPHLNTSGFMCLPVHLLRYPRVIVSREDRYAFEHGLHSWWEQMYNEGEKVKLVTWCGCYEWPQWRTPPNIACRGDQSNCITYFRINYDYENGDAQSKLNLEALTDPLTDSSFRAKINQ